MSAARASMGARSARDEVETREARAARPSARARRVSDMGAMVGGERGGGRRIPAHPYLVRQMSDFGFRQTLEVRTLGCARRFHLLPTCTPPPRQDLSYGKNSTRDTGFILVRATVVV